MTNIEIRRAAQRFHTKLDWLDSWHSFSFGEHYDPGNMHHGLLRVLNDDIVRAGTGFGTHPHRDMEIVTWVLDGELEHRDSSGGHGVIYPGLAQRMSAGSGVTHSEMNHSATTDVHLIQMWVLPDTHGIAPGYEQRDVGAELDEGGLVAVASGRGLAGAVTIHQREATLWAARPAVGHTIEIADAPHVHLYVAKGSGSVDDEELHTGDAVRLTDAGARAFIGGNDGAEILIWETA
ncbi:MAG TPA: pirin family protein [Acidimicrobiia bacterium]|jgi:redox-sensitive bicupin YhaK (pirin superfamily)|nr:pirin family protein [Acidimicrobiia bacterium]